MTTFNPSRDIPSLSDKVILITGGTAGLGKGSIEELAKHNPAHIILTGRNQKAADALIAQVGKTAPNVKLTFVVCDISSFASTDKAAQTILGQIQRLDIVMLNAGIMAVPNATSVDGYEIQFATNHLGHALLMRRLLPVLQSTSERYGEARVINMSSEAHIMAPGEGVQLSTLKSSQSSLRSFIIPSIWTCYGQSKIAQIFYSQQLAEHYPSVTSISVHPGVVKTGLLTNAEQDMFGKIMFALLKSTPVEQGHWHQCWAATVPKDKLKNGEYYQPIGQLNKGTKKSKDKQLARKLWEWTQKELDAWDATHA